MKQRLIKLLWLIGFVCIINSKGFAQTETNTEFINRMNYVFGALEKHRVPNGLLLDYAMELADIKSYNGVLTDSNKVNAGIVKDIYTTIATSAVHTNAGGFYSPDYMDSLWQTQRQPGIITLSGLYYHYARFKDNAVNGGYLTVSNDQFRDNYLSGAWQNPYQTEAVFAMSPPLHFYSGRNLQVVLPSNLWLTNSAGSVSGISVDFNDGAGYRTITMGQPININYADTGNKVWKFRLSLTSGGTLYSHTEMQIKQEPNDYAGGPAAARFFGGTIPLTADDPFLGEFSQGWITIDYANADLRLRRPLIVVEGFDPGHILNPENRFGETSFNTFTIGQLDDPLAFSQLTGLLRGANQQYDIIYVDWARGTDFLQRNALLLEEVIRRVNEMKANDGSTEPNVVLGQSMGGVIARWALRDMEIRGRDHQTRLFISWDAPQQGANVPLAYQHMGRHLRNLLVQTAIPTLLGGNNTIRLALNGTDLMDVPAARQMLYNRVLGNGQLDNAEHNTWQQELRTMGYPQQSRNIAVSNGSECGIGQGFAAYADLLNVNGRVNTRFLTDFIGSFTGPGLGFWGGLSMVTLKPQFLLGILPGRNDLIAEFNCKAQPENSTARIYKGKLSYKKKILWLVNVTTTITDRSRNADPSVLAIDGTPGGMYDVRFNLQDQQFRNWAVKYSLTASNIPHFNFIPTPSALDIGGGNTALTLTNYAASYVGATPPPAPLNTPFANFTTAFNTVTTSAGAVNNNEHHIQIATRNGNFVAEELNGNTNVRTNCSAFCENGVISGNPVVCTSQTFTAPFGQGVTYNWTVSNPSVATIAANGNQATVTRLGSGNITLSVNMTGACGITGLNTTVFVGPPDVNNITAGTAQGSGTMQGIPFYYNGQYPYWDNINYTKYFEFESLDGHYIFGQPPSELEQNPPFHAKGAEVVVDVNSGMGGSSIYLRARAYNTCGASDWRYLTLPLNSPYYYVVSPNPATDKITVSEKQVMNATASPQKLQAGITVVKVFDNSGNLRKQVRYGKGTKQAQVNASDLATGLYIIEITSGQYKERQQVVIQK